MKRTAFLCMLVLLTILKPIYGQSEAGAVFLLISPGARAGGMGEAQVAVANDVYASYWNPAGLAFLEGSELAMMHVNWLPNLADDLYYEFLAFKQPIGYGTLGGHLIYLNLGEQQGMDGFGNPTSIFSSFMKATSRTLSVGIQSNKYPILFVL